MKKEIREAIEKRIGKLESFSRRESVFNLDERKMFAFGADELKRVLAAIDADSTDPLLKVFH